MYIRNIFITLYLNIFIYTIRDFKYYLLYSAIYANPLIA